MSTDLRAIMARDARIKEMIADPDLTDDALLFALCLNEVCDRNETEKRRRLQRNWLREVGDLAKGAERNTYWAKRVIADDLPRYQPEGAGGRHLISCVAPMIRREGPCGKKTYTSFVDRDPETGAGVMIGYCTRHWSHELQMTQQRRWKAWEANGNPCPPANTGGVLMRYFYTDWDHMYFWASGKEPESGGKSATPPRPTFVLIQGGSQPPSTGASTSASTSTQNTWTCH